MRVLALAATVGAASMAFGAPVHADAHPVPAPLPAATRATSALSGADVLFLDSLVGRSRKLRAFFVSTSHPSFAMDLLQRLFGDSAANTPGVYTVNSAAERKRPMRSPVCPHFSRPPRHNSACSTA